MHENTTQNVRTKVHPLTSGYGCGSTATISGQLWLDSDYDGSVDNGELGYSGATVNLLDVDPSTGATTLGATTTTNTNLTGQNYQFIVGAGPTASYYEIQVVFPWSFFATQQTGYSQINAQGYSPVFSLTAGGAEVINAGISSMNDSTAQDDANGKIQDTVALRDAIQAGNNGPPQPAVTFYTAPNTALSGTISLKAALDNIKTSYNINGSGSSTLGVQGNGGAANPYRIFTVNAGVTSTISGLTIYGGFLLQNDDGAGILNNGNLTLRDDYIGSVAIPNQTAGLGGGIVNAAGAQLQLQTVTISSNTAAKGGGGLVNEGSVIIYDGVKIESNTSGNGGAGIENAGTIAAHSYVSINGNTNTGGGGSGVVNSGKFQIFDGGSISGNSSAGDGGGVNNSGGTMTLQGVLVQANGSSTRGGGIFVQSGKLTLTDVTIGSSGKNSASEGAGMYVKGGTVNMSGGAISSNSATFTGATAGGGWTHGGGGGLYVGGGTVTLTGVSINKNKSKLDGGGVFNSAGTLTLNTNINIGSNQADNQGGGMYLAGAPPIPSTTNFNGVTVSGNVALGFVSGVPVGDGVYQQNGANVNPIPPGPPNNNLTDNDDLGGNPVQGP